jgi:hypothetical protein
MICEEKLRLLNEYKAATSNFTSAATELREVASNCPEDRYEWVKRKVDVAKMNADIARDKLDRHAEQHGC